MADLIGQTMTEALSRVCGGIPVFGAVALDFDTHIRDPKTIYKGTAYPDRMFLLLFKGPVKPRFFYSAVPEKYIVPQDAVITAAQGNRIISINNEPAIAFIKGLGLFQDGEHSPSPSFPLIIEERDGTGPVMVVIHGIGPEKEVICTRAVRVGDVLSLGMVNTDYVIETANAVIRDIKNNGSGESFLMFSCLLRSILLGGNHGDEIELIRKELEGFSSPYMFISSAGEICPRYTETGKTTNQIYAYALIAIQF
jgi:hypothetical protein